MRRNGDHESAGELKGVFHRANMVCVCRRARERIQRAARRVFWWGGHASSGVPSNGVLYNGAPSRGVPSNGVPSNGVLSNGVLVLALLLGLIQPCVRILLLACERILLLALVVRESAFRWPTCPSAQPVELKRGFGKVSHELLSSGSQSLGWRR